MNARISPQLLELLLASIVLFAGIYVLTSKRLRNRAVLDDAPRLQKVLLTLIGAVTGFISGLTGVGGAVVSVPLMVLFGFTALASIGASQVIQVIASLSGTTGNVAYGFIDFGLAVPVATAEVIGICAGGMLAHAVDERVLRRGVALLCVIVGVFLVVRPAISA